MVSNIFHEEVFYTLFRPFRHPSSQFSIWGGICLETIGSDLQIVRAHPVRFVCTVLDGCEQTDQWITPGYHHVNRMCNLLTEEAHDWVPVEFRIERRSRFLTPLVLALRTTTLGKRVLENTTGQALV